MVTFASTTMMKVMTPMVDVAWSRIRRRRGGGVTLRGILTSIGIRGIDVVFLGVSHAGVTSGGGGER